MKYYFKIKGLDCANCAAELESKIQKVDGINEAVISFMTEKMTIDCDETIKEDVLEKIKIVIKKEEPDVTIEEL
jgi:copper chaperone CopZ